MEVTTTVVQYVPQETLPVVAGCFAFGSTLAASTLAQKVIGISTATKVLPSAIGFATVCVASLVSQHAAIASHGWVQESFYKNKKFQAITKASNSRRQTTESSSYLFNRQRQLQPHLNVGGLQIPMHDVRVCIIGLLAFRLLGGRFWAIAPSSYTNLGSYARWSIPCGPKYANGTERPLIELKGKIWGCHTCGKRLLFDRNKPKFIADHMPPKSVAKQMNNTWLRRWKILKEVQFRFYPQCYRCSSKQGSILSKASNNLPTDTWFPSITNALILSNAGGGRMSYFHGFQFRLNHLSGGVLAAATTVGATDQEIQTRNMHRFERLHWKIHDWSKQIPIKFSTDVFNKQ